MRVTLEMSFPFSACFDGEDGELIAHNYILRLATGEMSRAEEKRIRREIEEQVIHVMASRDLGKDVSFLRNIPRTEKQILLALHQTLATITEPYPILRLALERGNGSVLALTPS